MSRIHWRKREQKCSLVRGRRNRRGKVKRERVRSKEREGEKWGEK